MIWASIWYAFPCSELMKFNFCCCLLAGVWIVLFSAQTMLQVECAYRDFLFAVPHGDRLLRGSGLLPGLLVDLHAVLRPPILLHCHPEHLHRPRRHEPRQMRSASLLGSACQLLWCLEAPLTYVAWTSSASSSVLAEAWCNIPSLRVAKVPDPSAGSSVAVYAVALPSCCSGSCQVCGFHVASLGKLLPI